ncbi:hypothetical protein T05_13417 [Trichinella murrelli]|uniref:Uncharacterized protein n=1 Tax=Trichinella murrelli TaxID=144512 RepID=A0A0V0SQ64_9BILA|nr:hypothetical protein T05_13417 [Trichinella murrelli]
MQLCNQMDQLLFFLYSYLICKFLHNYKVNILSAFGCRIILAKH